MIYSLEKLDCSFNPMRVFVFFIIIPFTTLIYTAIKTITVETAFWVKKSGNIIYIFYMLNDFSKYLVSIYDSTIRFLLTYIILFSLTSYYPAGYFLTGSNIENIVMVIVVSICFSIIGGVIWKIEIGKYESAGS